jgi:hypothetical protein
MRAIETPENNDVRNGSILHDNTGQTQKHLGLEAFGLLSEN